jgi:hypothetical protein
MAVVMVVLPAQIKAKFFETWGYSLQLKIWQPRFAE